jgi:AcrR family transcriptional regulator
MGIYDPNVMSSAEISTNAAEPRSAKGRRTRTRLLEAAKVIFERDGFLEARIGDISEAAGLSHGSFYHYFDSKEQIFRELAESLEVSVLTMHEPGEKAAPDESPVDRIRSANHHYLMAYKREAKIMRVIEEVSRYDAEVLAVRVRRQQEFAEKLQASIVRLQRAGLADKSIEPRYAADALGGMVAKFAEMWFGQQGRYDMQTAVDQLTRLWTNALGLTSNPGAAPVAANGARKRAAKKPSR